MPASKTRRNREAASTRRTRTAAETRADATAAGGHSLLVTILLAVVHMLLFAAATPPLDLWPLIFVSPVPLVWLALGARSTRRAVLVMLAAGTLMWLLLQGWVAEVSAFDTIDVVQYDGELLTKQVTIDATVEMGDSSEERTMVVTLEKVVLGAGDDMIDGRWVISNIS